MLNASKAAIITLMKHGVIMMEMNTYNRILVRTNVNVMALEPVLKMAFAKERLDLKEKILLLTIHMIP